MEVWRPRTAYAVKQTEEWAQIMGEIDALADQGEVEDFYTHFLLHRARRLPGDWTGNVRDACDGRIAETRSEAALRRMDAIVGEIDRNG